MSSRSGVVRSAIVGVLFGVASLSCGGPGIPSGLGAQGITGGGSIQMVAISTDMSGFFFSSQPANSHQQWLFCLDPTKQVDQTTVDVEENGTSIQGSIQDVIDMARGFCVVVDTGSPAAAITYKVTAQTAQGASVASPTITYDPPVPPLFQSDGTSPPDGGTVTGNVSFTWNSFPAPSSHVVLVLAAGGTPVQLGDVIAAPQMDFVVETSGGNAAFTEGGAALKTFSSSTIAAGDYEWMVFSLDADGSSNDAMAIPASGNAMLLFTKN